MLTKTYKNSRLIYISMLSNYLCVRKNLKAQMWSVKQHALKTRNAIGAIISKVKRFYFQFEIYDSYL